MLDRDLWHICHHQFFPVQLTIRSEHTRKQYRFALNNFAEYLGRPSTLDDLTDDNLAGLVGRLLDGGMAEITANERVGRIKTLWTWLAKRNRVATFPTLQRVPTPEKIPRAWSAAELKRLFAACEEEQGMIAGVRASAWWLAFHGWLWNTSERKGATLLLEWSHLDLDASQAIVPAAIRKGRRKPAVYSLWPEVVESLRAISKPARRFVFPWPFHYQSYYNHYARILKRAELPTGRNNKTHAMRVSHATWREALGGDASKALGHANRSTTLTHYIDPRIARHDQGKLFWPGDPNPPRAA